MEPPDVSERKAASTSLSSQSDAGSKPDRKVRVSKRRRRRTSNFDFTAVSEDILRSLLANPSAVGLKGHALVAELELISAALLQKVKKEKRKFRIVFDSGNVQDHSNTLFYVLVDQSGGYHTNLTEPDLLALQNETEFPKAGFAPGAIGRKDKVFDLPGERAFLIVCLDRFAGIEERTKEIAALLLANNRLKELKYGSAAESWNEEIDAAGKIIANLAKLTPLGDYSAVVTEATGYIVKLYNYIKERNFKCVARLLHFSNRPAGERDAPLERAPLYIDEAEPQLVDMKRRYGHPVARFVITSEPADNVPENVDPAQYRRAQRASRFYDQNLLKEPKWLSDYRSTQEK